MAWFGVKEPKVSAVAEVGFDGGEEGYLLKANPGKIASGAKSLRGVKYAMQTLRQAAERESEGMSLKGYWLPALFVRDDPAIAFRGVHFCWFPECSAQLVEHQIRLAAYYKFNYAVLENWGCSEASGIRFCPCRTRR